MPSKQEDVGTSKISPVLFMTVDGEPMSFFLRPGPVKCKLQPLVTAGGGLLCKVQQPGAILLIDPEERDSITESTAHWFVSTQYILDCIEKEEQLNLEDYRLHPEVAPRLSARLNNSKESSPGLSGGRVAYTPEDDAAILSYARKHKTEIGGNRLWQEMEKQHVTSHSWQSMKYRYRARLAKKLSEAEEANTTEEDEKVTEESTKEEENQATDIQKPSSEVDLVSPPHLPEAEPSPENELTQIFAQPNFAISVTENVEVQTLSPSHNELQHVNLQNDAKTAEGEQVTIDIVASDFSPPEEPCLDPVTDVQPISTQSTQAKSAISPSNEGSAPSLPNTPSPVKREVKQKASLKLVEPQRRVTRRQLELESSSSPEPYGKRLRSSSNSAVKSSSTHQNLQKTKSSLKSVPRQNTIVDQLLSKRVRGENVVAVTEIHEEESEEVAVPETPQSGEEPKLLPQKEDKKKEKRKLGILELATKEFEDESESSEDEAADFQIPCKSADQPTSREPCLPASDTAADPLPTQSNPEPGPSQHIIAPDAQASHSKHVPETCCPKPAATETVQVASRAHLFIFDNESQEDNSQSLVGGKTAIAAQPVENNNSAPSLTQAQLEEDMQLVKDLMNQTDQDLVSVTKALLKTSGDFSAAMNLLTNPSSFSGPFWSQHHDSLLLSADLDARKQLQEKFSEEDLAKRLVFLEAEG